MKYIRKAGPPHNYSVWCRRIRGTSNENYGCLQNPEKNSLHRALVREQGWLCAYTMRRIDEGSSHIEHIKPETVCRSERIALDLDYKNLVACFPRDGMASNLRYGAQLKGNWWQNDGVEFVSPLHRNCEARFRFDMDGNINAVHNNSAAVNTIRVLGLNHRSLTEDRGRVIREFIYGQTGEETLSPIQARSAITTICNSNSSGRFQEFCVAIRDGLREHLQRLAKLAAKRRFRRRR
jgi:uncharacterized protein (TIGR02646 family)